MQIQVVNKGIDVSAALRERVSARVSDAVTKYFSRGGEAFVVVSREGGEFRAECSVHLPEGAHLNAGASAGDAYSAVDQATERLETRLRRFKRRLNDQRTSRGDPADAALVVLARPDVDVEDEDAGDAADGEPLVVAETTTDLRTLTVGMAVLELSLNDSAVMMFKNAAHGGLNVVYRRPDGHIGWIDPERADGSERS